MTMGNEISREGRTNKDIILKLVENLNHDDART